MFVARYLDSHTTIGGEKAKPAVQSRVQSNKTVKEFLEAWLPTRPSPEEVDWRIHSRERFESNKAAIADQLGSKFAAVEGGKRDWMRDKARIKGARHYQDDVLSLLSASTAPSESSLEDQLAAKKAELDDAQQEVDEMTSRVKAEAGKEYETVTKIIDEDVGPASQALERYWQEVEEKTAARAERIQADSGLRRAMDTAMATVDYTDNASKLIAKTDELRKVPEQLTESRSVEKEKDIIDSFIVQARLCITQATSVAPRIGAVVSKRMEILIEESKNITYTKLEDLVTSSWEWMMSTVTVESLSRPRSPPVTGKDVIGLVNILDEVEGLYSEVAQTGSFTSNDGCWSFEALTTKLLQQRFLYHFAREGASTNRLDRPEWAIARFVDIWKHSQTVFDRWLAEAGQENSADLKKKLDLNFAKSLGKYFWDSRWPIVLDSTQLFAHHLSQYLAAVSDVEVFAGEESSDELIRSLTASPVLLQAWASADLAACTSSLNQVENPWSPDETRTAFNALGSTLIDLIENESTTRTCYLTKNSTAMAYFTESMYWPLIERFISMEKEKWNDLPTLSGEDEPTARLIQQSLEGIFKWLMEGPFDDKRLQALLSEHAQEIGDLGDKMAEMIQEECGS